MDEIDFTLLGILLFVSSMVAMVTRRLNLPYSVGLVAAGIILALLPFGLELPLTPELVFSVFLPPLVFEAAIQIPWKPFRRELPVLLALVTAGVLIAATDPVSAIALFKNIDVDHRLHLLVEAESLNDGVAAVALSVLARWRLCSAGAR